ncbi:MAG: hypothetical protein KF767_06745 [Bdellovibrionaceae bacterium]|nr:hypothetical protein [Pseudobdellovibrionaceae bacterium]
MKINFGRSEILLLALGTGAALTLFLAGCAQQTDSNANSFTQVYNASFSVTCMNCHAGAGSSSGTNLDFTSADAAYAGLINVAVQIPSNPSKCGGVRRVVPGDATNSYLLGVLFSEDNHNNFAGSNGCQPPTAHLSLVNLSAAERSSLQAWINAGAAR